MILTLALLISCVPNQVYAMAGEALADWLNATDTAVLQPDATPDPVLSTAHIVAEDESRRGETYKEYIMNNGLRLATVYPSAIHYEDNGQWKDIDNTLVAAVSGGKAVYQNAAGAWNVRFPRTLSGNDMVGVTKDGYTVQFGMAGELRSTGDLVVASVGQIGVTADTLAVSNAQTATAQIQQLDLTAARAAAEHPETVLEKLNSRLSYANVYPNTNVVYDLQGNQLKESVVLQRYDADLWGYRYTLDTGDLVPVLREDQQIDLCHPKTSEVILTMPAPYMLDNNGETSYDVEVTLTRSGNMYLLSYYVPREWLADADRAWPVILDPVISADSHYSNMQDRTVAETFAEAYNHGTIQCGYYNSGIMRFFMKYVDLPQLTSADVVVDATITLMKPANSSKTAVVEVHKVNEQWDSQNITWSNQPAYNKTIEDYAVCLSSGRYDWNITDIVRDWYANENTGMMFKVSDAIEAAQEVNWKQFYSSDFDSVSTLYKPLLTITFRNANGLEDYWDYTASSAGRAGAGYVNNYNGNLVWIHGDIGFGGNRMPVSISHIYNANDSHSNQFGMGYGWRTNYNQRVYVWSKDSSYYVWEDSDGTLHYFYQAHDGAGNEISNTYLDEDGLYLTLTTGGSGNEKYQLTDQSGNKSYFDTKGRLVKIENSQQTKSNITITYTTTTGNLINTVTDGAGRVYAFTYTNNLLSRISYKGSGASEISYVTYGYTGSLLTSIAYQDGETVTYAYGDRNLLLSAQDIDGYLLVFTYNLIDTTAMVQPSRVASITEYDGGYQGGQICMEYANNQTTFTDKNGNKQIMQFNSWGNAVAIMDDQGRGQFASYNTPESKTEKGNQLRLSSKLQNTVANMLKNNSFEGDYLWNRLSYDISVEFSTETAYSGTKSLKMTRAVAGAADGVWGSTFTAQAGETYTFSAYVKTVDGAEAYLQIVDSSNVVVTSETLEANSDWTRLEVNYTATSAQQFCVELMTETAGTVYMDCVQLERTPTASRYNLVDNGDFNYDNYAWTLSPNAGSDNQRVVSPQLSKAPQLDNYAYQMQGNPQGELYIYQDIAVSGNAGDTFVLAGWAKGDSAPLTEAERSFCIRGVFTYENGETDIFDFSFNPDADSSVNWQYAAGTMIAAEAYTKITVYLMYDHNVNTVLFDGIQLYKEEFGYTYSYDDNGNITSIEDLEGQTTEYTYNEEQELTEVELSTGATTAFEHDDYHNVLTETSDTGVVTTYTYDAFGNNTSVSIGSGEDKITTTATYSADGNRLVSTTDAQGKVTTYSYNADTNVLEWVQYPEDTAATRTEYTYDAMYRMTHAEVTTSSGCDLSASYAYTDDLLTQLTTASTTYTFGYCEFGLNAYVAAGEHILAAYYYSVETLYMQEMWYGNLDYVEYVYDDYGRVVETKYHEDGSENIDRTIKYQYDNNGALATVYDSDTGIKTTYYYDFTDRLVKYVESGGNYNHSVGYRYDELGNLSVLTEIINGVEHTSSYTYDDDNRITNVTVDDFEQTYGYDDYGRLTEVLYQQNDQWHTYKIYEYLTVDGQETNQVGSLWLGLHGGGIGINYDYDDNGNITTVDFGSGAFSYAYDSQNQLIRENNEFAGKTWVWTYDDAGNILKREEYAYTTGELGEVLDTVVYTYGDDSWGDLLTAYDGATITYDEIGNPLSDGTWTYTWERGRQLASMSDGTTTWTYTYDADGMRTSRTNGTDTYTYVYNGGLLTQMTKGEDTLFFTYDALGMPATVTHNGTVYFYLTTLQGDVLAIVDANDNIVAEYITDAWGKVCAAYIDPDCPIAELNPLIYRGYVYDIETGLYYLQSRYYSPEVGRFINADGLASTGQGLTGSNMFAYCANSPVITRDESGFAFDVVVDVVSAVISLGELIVCPSWANFGYLLWDIGSAFVPFLPGSYIAKGGKLAIKIASKLDDLMDGSRLLTGTYNKLKNLFRGMKGIELHHLIEKRFKRLFSCSPGDFLSIPLAPELHRIFTNRWRNLHKISKDFKNFRYGGNYSKITWSLMERAIKKVYGDVPWLLDDVLEWFYKNWKW